MVFAQQGGLLASLSCELITRCSFSSYGELDNLSLGREVRFGDLHSRIIIEKEIGPVIGRFLPPPFK